MNPVLLKPQSEVGAQVVVQGRVVGNAKAREYQAMKGQLLPRVLESFARLSAGADLIVVEGAGSPAEVNRSEEHTSELQSLMSISYAVFSLKQKKLNVT